MKKRIIVGSVIYMVMIMAMVIICDSYAVSAKTKRKTYPEVDTKLDNYKYVTEFPEIIMTTSAEENGLAGNCYKITGTIKGIYSSDNKALKALGRKEALKEKDSEMKTKCMVVKTSIGDVIVVDYYNYFYDILSLLYGSNKDELKQYLKDNGYNTKKYKEYPKKSEKVTVLATYTGYSSVFDMPIFYYGINQGIVSSVKGSFSDNDIVKNNTEQKISYNYKGITFEYPESWNYKTEKDNLVTLYPDGGVSGSLVLSGIDYDYNFLLQYEADQLVNVFGKDITDFKVNASKVNEYKGKKIDTYYIYSFKCKMNSKKCKGRMTLFVYNYKVYVFVYVCPTDNVDVDKLFDEYTEIIKSIKAK